MIELLVAIALLGVVVTIVTSVYVPANRQMWMRAREADHLDSLFLWRGKRRVACREVLEGVRLMEWGSQWDSCLFADPRSEDGGGR